MRSETPLQHLSINDTLPELAVTLTRKMIVMGATSSRDWQPIHHDEQWAKQSAGLPDIIMNNYTQAGWISRYVTDWSGPSGRLGRLKFSMRSPLCPGDNAKFSGVITDISQQNDGIVWVEVDITIKVEERLATTASVKVALPESGDQPSPWLCPSSTWQP